VSPADSPTAPVQLGLVRRPVRVAEHGQPHGAVRDQVGHVHRRAPVDAVQVPADGPPGPVQAGRVAVPAGELVAELVEAAVVDRRVAQPVLTEDLAGHALAHLGLVRGVGQHGQLRVGVHVHEARGHHQAGDVKHRTGLARVGRADRADPAAGDHHVGAAAQDQIRHRRLRPLRPCKNLAT
jgi:hypothetical protein